MSRSSPISLRRQAARKGRSALARVLSGFWMLLYLGIVGGAPVADGFMDHGQQIVVHVEDADGGHCPASHGAEACDICHLAQGLRTLVSPTMPEIPRLADAGSAATAAREIAAQELTFLDGRSSRAPPLG